MHKYPLHCTHPLSRLSKDVPHTTTALVQSLSTGRRWMRKTSSPTQCLFVENYRRKKVPMEFDNDEDEMPTLVELNAVTKKIPVSILTGFLGSGKSTLLNYILRQNHGKKIAIIENEFSAGLGIENMIAKSGVDGQDIAGFFELNNGCICCTVKDDLLATLEQLVLHKDRFDYVLIETTGVANPGPIISSLWADDEADSTLILDGVITVVDSVNILHYLASPETSNDVRTQIAYADRILLNKSDLVTGLLMDEVEVAVREVNASAELRRTCQSEVSTDWVLDSNSFSLSDLQRIQLAVDRVPPVAGSHCDSSCGDLCSTAGCGHTADEHSHKHAAPHSAATLSTHGFTFGGCVELARLKILLDRLLYSFSSQPDEANDGATLPAASAVYRMKGVFHVKDDNHLHILQAVHDIFDIQASSFLVGSAEDASTGGCNKVIVIGKNIDSEHIERELKSCVVIG